MANAFPSIAHEERDRVVEDKYGTAEDSSLQIVRQRYRGAYMYAQTETGGALVGALVSGGMQGDSVMPDQFTVG